MKLNGTYTLVRWELELHNVRAFFPSLLLGVYKDDSELSKQQPNKMVEAISLANRKVALTS